MGTPIFIQNKLFKLVYANYYFHRNEKLIDLAQLNLHVQKKSLEYPFLLFVLLSVAAQSLDNLFLHGGKIPSALILNSTSLENFKRKRTLFPNGLSLDLVPVLGPIAITQMTERWWWQSQSCPNHMDTDMILNVVRKKYKPNLTKANWTCNKA